MLDKTKHLFIVNPTAGGRDASGEVRAKVEKAFADRDDEYEIYITKAAMDAPERSPRKPGNTLSS